MITLQDTDELPDSVPPLLVDALKLCRTMDEAANEFRDRNLEAYVIRYKVVDGKLEPRISPAAQGGRTRRLTEDLKELLYTKSVKKSPGRHVGTGMFAEGLHVVEGAQVPDVEGAALTRLVAEMIEDGRAVRLRTSFAIFSDGWRFQHERTMAVADDTVTITIYEPGEPWDGGEHVELLQALDDKLSTRG